MKKNYITLLLFLLASFGATEVLATLNLTNRDVEIFLKTQNSVLFIPNYNAVDGYEKQQIFRNSCPDGVFLTDNQQWGTSGNIFVSGDEPFEFINDLKIPESTSITFSANVLVDGKNFALLLGRRAQLFIDSGVTVTFKNIIIKNTLNTSSMPVIKCIGSTSQLCLDNVRFELNDDFVFGRGQLFFHNDVEFTGTSKLSYRSTSASYIAAQANLIFGPQTTFEYYPGSADNYLIRMLDKTSAIVFDGSTLQTTQTGIRLTKGSLYFDNKITLSSTNVIRPSQSFYNAIIFGNSSVGSDQDLDIYLLAAARVGIYGKVWQDSVNSGVNFQGRDSYISLDRNDSKFKITSATHSKGFKKSQIIKGSVDNTLFLQDNQVWQATGDISVPGENFEFMDDFKIPDGQLVEFSSNIVLDGQGHDLILGKYAQLLVDGGVTVTFKNMTIKNTLNTLNIPPIRCMDWYSQACFDNVTFAFNDDWAFRNGQFFIHNDVEFTGTSKFSYRSTMPSYITSHANLIFDPLTTFEYYPGSADNNLIKMADKTSNIIFDGCTLQVTETGIRFTKGSLYFDNTVTLSRTRSLISTYYGADLGTPILQDYGTGDVATIYSAQFSPNGRYLAIGGSSATIPHTGVEVYYFNGTSLAITTSIRFGTAVYAVAWSPNGDYLAVGGAGPLAPFAEAQIYSLNISTSSLTITTSVHYVTTTNPSFPTYVKSLAWRPDGQYLAVGGYTYNRFYSSYDGVPLKIYSFNGSHLSFVTKTGDTLGYVEDLLSTINSLDWTSDGQYLVAATKRNSTVGAMRIYYFDGISSLEQKTNFLSTNMYAAAWSPDGQYVACGSDNSRSGYQLYIYYFNRTSYTATLKCSVGYGNTVVSVDWASDGQTLAVGGYAPSGAHKVLELYRFDGSLLTLLNGIVYGTVANSVNFQSAVGNYLAVGGQTSTVGQQECEVYPYQTRSWNSTTNGIIFGNSSLGSAYDADMYILGGANVIVAGKVLYDDVN